MIRFPYRKAQIMLKRIGAALALAITATLGITASAQAVSCNSWAWHSTINNGSASACVGINRASTSALSVTVAIDSWPDGTEAYIDSSGGSTWVRRATSYGSAVVRTYTVYCANGDGSKVYHREHGPGGYTNFATYTC